MDARRADPRKQRYTHQLNEWPAQHEGRLKNSTYNEYARFLKDLFEIAVHDRVIAKSPFAEVKTKWKKPQKPSRLTPSPEEFKAIVADIRAQRFNPDASASTSASADFVEFLGLAGLGQKEAGTLLWSQIDQQQKRMGIRRHKTGTLFYVPIYPHLAPLLERLHRQRESPEQDGLVFEIKDAKKALSAACVRLGMPNYSQRATARSWTSSAFSRVGPSNASQVHIFHQTMLANLVFERSSNSSKIISHSILSSRELGLGIGTMTSMVETDKITLITCWQESCLTRRSGKQRQVDSVVSRAALMGWLDRLR